MDMSTLTLINILIIFILLLFTLLLFNVGRHTKSNQYLGVYFISQILVLTNFTLTHLPILLYSLLLSIQYAWGALFYLFICSLLEPDFQFTRKNLVHFIPMILVFLLLLFSIDSNTGNQLQQNFPLFYKYRVSVLVTFFNILIVGYNIAAIRRYYIYRANVRINPRLANKVPSTWLNIALWGFVVSCTLVQAGAQLNNTMPREVFDWKIIGNSAFLLYFCILFYVAVVSRTLTEKFDNKEKYKNSNLGEPEALQLVARLDDFMNTQTPFSQPDLKLKELAETLRTTERNLSQVINEYKQQNFPDYINSYRVKYAMQLLSDPKLKEKTILWVLFEAGFNSKSSFNTIFKKIVGCTPAEYRKKPIQ